MKNSKRILAVLGIVILLAAAVLPMIFAFGSGENSGGRFRAALAVAIMVPVIAYVMLLVYRLLSKRRQESGSAIRNVVFDVGQVLLAFDWRGYLDSFGFDPETKKTIENAVFLSDVWNERDRGTQTPAEYIDRMVADAPECEKEIRLVMKDVRKCMKQMDYADSWVSFLKDQGYRLFVLSNYSEDTLEETRDLMTFLPMMDGVIFSCYEKLIKPEPEIYRLLLSRYHLKPEETVFIDDREDNCQGARACGIRAIRFESFRQAAGELERMLQTDGKPVLQK